MTSPFEMKTCSICKQDLPKTAFRARGAYWHSCCRRCERQYEKQYRAAARAPIYDTIMSIVFNLLNQHGPMQSASIIALVQQQRPDIELTHQGLFAAVKYWEHSDYVIRQRDMSGIGYVYRVVGDTRPVFFEKSALEKERAVDDPEADAWWASLQAEVAERKARRARMQW